MPTRLQPLYLVVDAGGTKTAAAIAGADGALLGEGGGGPANMAELGMETAANEIMTAVCAAVAGATRAGSSGSACASASTAGSGSAEGSEGYLCPLEFGDVWIGVSGCDSELDVQRLTLRLAPSFRSPVTVMNDALLLSVFLRAHQAQPPSSRTHDGPLRLPDAGESSGSETESDNSCGVPTTANGTATANATPWLAAAVAGTGSIALGISPTGQFAKRGGHGHLFGDVGSAYHLGLCAIRTAADDYDEGVEVPGGLAAALRKKFGVDSTADVPARCHDVPIDMDPVSAQNARKLRIASLAPTVLTLAPTCPLAARVLREVVAAIAADLASIARVATKHGLQAGGGLALTGGLGVQPLYVAALVAALEEQGVRFGWIESVEAPARQCAVALSQCARGA